jgi:hypothetical protein
MDSNKIASELVKIAKSLIAIEFDSKEAYDKYMKEHPEADKSNHSVKENKTQKIPANNLEKHKEIGKKLHDALINTLKSRDDIEGSDDDESLTKEDILRHLNSQQRRIDMTKDERDYVKNNWNKVKEYARSALNKKDGWNELSKNF